MVASLTYRTADGTRWGGGLGSDLSATQIDLNFWTLFAAVGALEDHNASASGAGIDYMVTAGNQLFVHLTDHRVLGPLTIPTSNWNAKGNWAPATLYAAFDVIANNGSLYLVLTPHTSGATFSVAATDGLGHNLYSLLLQQPSNQLPSGGTVGQRLAKSSGSPYVTQWESDLIRMASFVGGQPAPNQLLMQYLVVDHMTLPAGLAGSIAYSRVPTGSNVQYTISKNGAAIGSINFNGPSPETITVTFGSPITFVPGDIIGLNAPSIPDSIQADISFTLVALLTA